MFADKYIAVHLEETAGGQTYSQVSEKFLQDPTNQKLAQQRQTLFMGETLRGMLLSAWGWGTVGTVATIAGIVLIGIGGILPAVPLLAAFAARRREPAASVGPCGTHIGTLGGSPATRREGPVDGALATLPT